MFKRRSLPLLLVLSVCVFSLALSGCGMVGDVATTGATQSAPVSGTPSVAPGQIGGMAHGGRQAIVGGTVTLWAAGNTGYGTGATQIAQTTTDSGGFFNLNAATVSITAYSISSNVVTFTAGNTLAAGNSVTLSGFPTSTFFNGLSVTVLAQGLSSTQFEANFTNPDVSSTTESGVASWGNSNPLNAQCTTGDHNYITVTGGNPGGGTNNSSALLLALPTACAPATTGGQFVVINEATTVASVWALQQFMSITPGGTPAWQIGAPASNTNGLKNAFASVAQLINNLPVGTSGSSVVANNVSGGSEPGTYYTVITPDSARLYMVADILADCVNSDSTTPLICSSLFAAVSPSGAMLPTDTIQVAYDIATAPGGVTAYSRPSATTGTIPAGTALTNPTNSCTGVGCAWALYMCQDFVNSTAVPYATTACTQGTATIPTYPTDFAIGVRWTGYDTAGRRYGVAHGDNAIDTVGNVWSAATASSATSTGYPLVEWDPQGRILQAVGGTFTLPSTASISANLVATGGTAVAGGPYTFTLGTAEGVSLAPATSVVPFIANGLAIDTNDNAWISAYTAGDLGGLTLTTSGNNFYPGMLLQVANAGVTSSSTPTTAAYSSVTAVSGTGSVATITSSNSYTVGESIELLGFTVDTALNGPATVINPTSTSFQVASTVTATDTGYAIPAIVHGTSTAGTATPFMTGSTPGPLAIDSANNIWLATKSNSTSSSYFNPLTMMTAASSYGTLDENQTGSSAGYVVMVDGMGMAWVTSNQSAPGKVIIRATPVTALSSASTYNMNGTNYNGTTPAGVSPRYGALDGNSNLWVAEGSDTSASGQMAYFQAPNTGFSPLPAVDVLYKTASNVTSTTYDNNGAYSVNIAVGGLATPCSVGVDGVGNVFFGNCVTSTSGGISEYTIAGGSLSAISPTNSSTGMPAFGFNDYVQDKPSAEVIDRSGNLWIGNASNSYVGHMIGLAAPVVTPMSSAVTPIYTTITAWSIGATNTVATFNTATTNTYTVGQKLLLSGFGTTTTLNGQIVAVTGTTGSAFTATLQTAGTANTGATESGVAAASNLATRP